MTLFRSDNQSLEPILYRSKLVLNSWSIDSMPISTSRGENLLETAETNWGGQNGPRAEGDLPSGSVDVDVAIKQQGDKNSAHIQPKL